MSTQTNERIGPAYLAEARRRLAAAHERIRHCLGQLDEDQVWWRPGPAMNSVANLVLHLCGNLRQWIVAGAGGAPDARDRPAEFAARGPLPPDELLRRLDAAVAEADQTLARLGPDQLLQARRIQGFDETLLSAIFDSIAHLAGHAQEIVCLTRLQLGDAYRFAWVPATPEQGAPKGSPGEETVAARDAVFEQDALAGLKPPSPAEKSPPRPAEPPGSPLNDYLRELEQEFQDQEDEGKV